MHEMGIVTHLAKTLDETARKNGIRRIGSVVLQVGEVSGIIFKSEKVKNSFKLALTMGLFQGAISVSGGF